MSSTTRPATKPLDPRPGGTLPVHPGRGQVIDSPSVRGWDQHRPRKVHGFDWDGTGRGIVAVCVRKGRRYRVSVTALEWPGRSPTGAIWFDAYRAWLRGAW